jgi:hypothetical protein
MRSRAEITKRYAKEYAAAPKAVKSQILDDVVRVTGWSRANARRRLTARANEPAARGRRPAPRAKAQPRKYSYDALKVLQRVWAVSGGQCGKYLAPAMETLLDNLEAHGRLVAGRDRYSARTRAELLAMSPATIDRYLAPAKASGMLKGKSTTKAGSMLRNSITIRKAGDEVDQEPGFFEVDTVAHCGPTLKGEFARTLNMTDVHTGWTFTWAIRNNARVHMIAALELALQTIPYQVQGFDFDNGSEFINHEVVEWAGTKDIYFTRSRPYKKNDQATIESKNNHLVRRYGFYWRYDTQAELDTLRQLWPLVNDLLNYFTPTKKPVGWATDQTGRRKRLYDAPATPLDRLLRAGTLSPTQQTELTTRRDALDVAAISHDINRLQARLMKLSAAKTRQLQDQAKPKIPDPEVAPLTRTLWLARSGSFEESAFIC